MVTPSEETAMDQNIPSLVERIFTLDFNFLLELTLLYDYMIYQGS